MFYQHQFTLRFFACSLKGHSFGSFIFGWDSKDVSWLRSEYSKILSRDVSWFSKTAFCSTAHCRSALIWKVCWMARPMLPTRMLSLNVIRGWTYLIGTWILLILCEIQNIVRQMQVIIEQRYFDLEYCWIHLSESLSLMLQVMLIKVRDKIFHQRAFSIHFGQGLLIINHDKYEKILAWFRESSEGVHWFFQSLQIHRTVLMNWAKKYNLI